MKTAESIAQLTRDLWLSGVDIFTLHRAVNRDSWSLRDRMIALSEWARLENAWQAAKQAAVKEGVTL